MIVCVNQRRVTVCVSVYMRLLMIHVAMGRRVRLIRLYHDRTLRIIQIVILRVSMIVIVKAASIILLHGIGTIGAEVGVSVLNQLVGVVREQGV